MALRPNAGHSFLILDVSRSHKEAPQSVGLLTSDRSFTEPVLDNTQHSQQRNIHAPGRIRTRSLSRRVVAYLRFRPRAHWDRHIVRYVSLYVLSVHWRVRVDIEALSVEVCNLFVNTSFIGQIWLLILVSSERVLVRQKLFILMRAPRSVFLWCFYNPSLFARLRLWSN